MRVAKPKKKTRGMGSDGISNTFAATDNGETTVFRKDKLIENDVIIGAEQDEMFYQLARACGAADKGGGCKPAEQLRIFRKYVPRLITLYNLAVDVQKGALKNADRAINATTERSGKRWTPEEDEVLVELASRDEESAFSIATKVGRTPGAVQSRLSQLVGIGKISQEIAGRFIGTLNGEHVVGVIDGELTKQ